MGPTPAPNPFKKAKNRMRGLGVTEATSWGKVHYCGVSIPQGQTANREDDNGNQKTTEEITFKK